MAQVLDYSAGFPGAQAILDAGYAGAVRYIGFPDRAKCTNAGELADFTAHGIGMALVFENTLTDWRGGYAQGAKSGVLARNHANAIHFPGDRPIYMAIDQDVVSSGEFATMLDYLHGAGSVLGGPGLTGVYGEADVIDRARDAGVAAWYWQTVAWSHGRRTTAHLFQNLGTVKVGGVDCDVNDVLQPNWGQQTGVIDMTPDECYNVLATFFKDTATGKAPDIKTLWHDFIAGAAWDGVASMLKAVRDGQAEDMKAILNSLGNTQLAADPAAFAAIFAPVLAPVLAPLVKAGATPEQVQAAATEGVRLALAKAVTP